MDNSFFSDIAKTFGFIILFIVVIFYVNFVVGQGGLEASISKIDASGVVIIKSNDSIAQDYFFINFVGYRDLLEKNVYKINASDAVIIVSNNSIAQNYMSENFEMPKWRVINVSMLVNSTYDFDGSEYLWDVKIMERTCACNSIKDLYVIEGQVSPITGDIINITTGLVLESNYDKQMCASTVCH